MHDIVRRNWVRFGTGLQLMRLPADDGERIMAFRRGRAYPVWVAQRGIGRMGCLRVQSEKRALEWIEPWHSRLGVPSLIDFMQTDTETWMVRTGLCGAVWPIHIEGFANLPEAISRAAEWLHDFQEIVAAPASTDLQALALTWAHEADARPDGWSSPLWQQVRSTPISAMPAVATHGDFWTGNLLFERRRMGVVDWNNFHAGTPLEDMLILLMKTPKTQRRRLLDPLRSFIRTFFADSPTRHLLLDWTRRHGLSAREARFCFYLCLARRLRWELGFGLQSRSPKSIAQTRYGWQPILAWLADRDYPDPFHCAPAAAVANYR